MLDSTMGSQRTVHILIVHGIMREVNIRCVGIGIIEKIAIALYNDERRENPKA
jgi:hypothetical protein